MTVVSGYQSYGCTAEEQTKGNSTINGNPEVNSLTFNQESYKSKIERQVYQN